MSTNQIKFTSFTPEFYAGITPNTEVDIEYPAGMEKFLKDSNSEDGIVIVFPDGYNFVLKEGNQETGKTSIDAALIELIGGEAAPNAINSIAKNKSAKVTLTGKDGHLYNIRLTKSQFVVERIETDPETGEIVTNEKGKEVKSTMSSPKTFINSVVGPAGISPYAIKAMKPGEQVLWLRGLYTLSPEVLKEEQTVKSEYDKTYKERTKAGNEYDRYEALVKASKYYDPAKYEEHEKFFTNTNFDDLETQFEATKAAYQDYSKFENGLKTLKEVHLDQAKKNVGYVQEDITSIENQIAQLQKQLEEKKKTLAEREEAVTAVEKRITDGEAWMEANKSTKEEYDNMSVKLVAATEFKANKQEWDTMVLNKKQEDHYSDEWTRLTNRLDELKQAKKKIVSLFQPEIEGFEVCIPEEGDSREGLFYKGHPFTELAESALWEICTLIWKAMGVKVIFVENIISLGTGAVEKFNEFLEAGGYIFANQMNRALNKMKITFHKRIV